MSIWRRVLWAIQLVVFVTAGFFVVPTAGRVQNATVASAPHSGERVAASREHSGERVRRSRSDESGGALAFTPPSSPIVAPASFVIDSPRVDVQHAQRQIRFEPYAPRGPPQQG